MTIILRRPWTSQSLGVPRVDFSNRATFGLKNAFVFSFGTAFDAARNIGLGVISPFGASVFSAVPGGSGFGLYTGNGSCAEIFVNEDWSGPSTTLWQCFTNGVDNPWGGLWSKNTAGDNQQLGVGRLDITNNWYVGRENDNALVLTSTSISSSLGRAHTFAFTNETATSSSSAVALYQDGALVQAANYAGVSQLAGAGSLYLGSARNFSAAYDSDVYWTCFLRFGRVLSAAEIARIGNNPWQLFQPRRIALSEGAAVVIVPPTLLAASATSITTSSAIPRVTFTRL